MAFTFFWLVIGDLIVLHQKAIYGFDPFSHHTPYANTNNSPVKTKTDKGLKVKKSKVQYHFDVVLNSESSLRVVLNAFETELTNTFFENVSQFSQSNISLRAPPLLY